MRVSEIFHSIQGEIQIGKPSIFIRLAGCNLRCTKLNEGFDCDSQYAYKGEDMSIRDLINKIKSYPCKHVIFTGGEPTLQKTEIYKLIHNLPLDYSFSIETNGTSLLNRRYFRGGVIVVSPKKQKIDLKILKEYAKISKCYFKFIILNHQDFMFWKDIVDKLKIPNHKVYMMPVGMNAKELNEKSISLIEDCKKYNYCFTPRLHINIYGNERGR